MKKTPDQLAAIAGLPANDERSFVPALRATRIDPLAVLREE